MAYWGIHPRVARLSPLTLGYDVVPLRGTSEGLPPAAANPLVDCSPPLHGEGLGFGRELSRTGRGACAQLQRARFDARAIVRTHSREAAPSM
jgi:hypothetical protein